VSHQRCDLKKPIYEVWPIVKTHLLRSAILAAVQKAGFGLGSSSSLRFQGFSLNVFLGGKGFSLFLLGDSQPQRGPGQGVAQRSGATKRAKRDGLPLDVVRSGGYSPEGWSAGSGS
jgi:hypothetical protein